MLSEAEKNRYNRHILLPEVGISGQEKLKNARVLVIGSGGLGCPCLQYLTAAGIGTIGIVDFDVVEESNLQRQILFTSLDIGKNKAFSASERLKQLNPYVQFEVYQEKIGTSNALEIFAKYDIIIDGTDNFSTRYLVNDASIITGKPLISGSIFKFEGQISVFNYKNGPSYRCLFPEPPAVGSVPNCSEIGVIGVLAGIIGTQQANEAIKIILDLGDVLSGKLLIYSALQANFMKLDISKNESEIEKVIQKKANFKEMNYDLFCGISISNDISADELKQLLKQEKIQIIDVRESHEMPKIELLNALNIPLMDLEERVDEVSKTQKVVIFCQHGIRSKHAIDILEEQGFNNLINLNGGIVRWTD